MRAASWRLLVTRECWPDLAAASIRNRGEARRAVDATARAAGLAAAGSRYPGARAPVMPPCLSHPAAASGLLWSALISCLQTTGGAASRGY